MIKKIKEFFSEWRWIAVALLIAGMLIGALILGSVTDVGAFGAYSVLLDLLVIPVAVASLFLSLRLADRLGGMNWGRLRSQIMEEPMTATAYAVGRWISMAIIISAVIR